MNKIKFGLRNVYYAKLTSAYDESTGKYTYTYATPVAIPGGVNLSLSASGDSNDMYADDVIYYSSTTNQGYDGDLEIALIPESFLTDIMGFTKDTNGAIVEDASVTPSGFALGFEVQGDEKGRRTWFYNCTASRSAQNASTKESSTTPSTESLTIKAMPRLSDTLVKVSMVENATNTTVYNKFFESVYEKTTSQV